MNITKRGIPPQERVWIGKCNKCGSEAEANQCELHNITDDPREGTQFSWENCPVCDAGDARTGYGGMLFYPKPKGN